MNKQSLLYVSPKSTFYNTKKEVINENLKIHEETFSEDRDLYTYLLYFKDSKYYAKKLIIENLLKNSLYKEEMTPENEERIKIEDYLIYKSLMTENITHALKMLLGLKENKINNSRTSKLILRFLFDRGNTDYICIKYKKKIKDLLIHAIGLKKINIIINKGDGGTLFNKHVKIYKNPFAFECISFVFDKDYDYTSKYLLEYIKARKIFKENKTSLKIKKGIVPIEVLEGFSSTYNGYIDIKNVYEVANVSSKQKIQRKKVVEKTISEKVDINYEKYSAYDLIKVLYNGELNADDEIEVLKQLNIKYEELHNESKNYLSLNVDETAFILDCSSSMAGGKDSKLSAFYNSVIMTNILSLGNNVFYCNGKMIDNRLYPDGDTNLSESFLEAVENEFKNVVIISDGFENVGDIEAIYEKLRELNIDINVLHLNPVFSPKNMEFKKLSNNFITLPFNEIKDLKYTKYFNLLNTNPCEFKRQMKELIVNEISSSIE